MVWIIDEDTTYSYAVILDDLGIAEVARKGHTKRRSRRRYTLSNLGKCSTIVCSIRLAYR